MDENDILIKDRILKLLSENIGNEIQEISNDLKRNEDETGYFLEQLEKEGLIEIHETGERTSSYRVSAKIKFSGRHFLKKGGYKEQYQVRKKQRFGEFIKSYGIPISSLIIALMAVLISIYQGDITKENNILSVRPAVSVKYSNEGARGIFLKNSGLGPAVIENIEAIYYGDTFKLNNGKEISSLLKGLNVSQAVINPTRGYYLAEKEIVPIVAVNSERLYYIDHDSLVDFMRNSLFYVTYQSIYDEKFSYESDSATFELNDSFILSSDGYFQFEVL